MNKATSKKRPSWSLENLLGAAGARALLTALGTAGVVLSVPGAMLDRLIDISGIGETVSLLAPPLSLPLRIGIAATLGVIAGLVVFFGWRSLAPKAPSQSSMPASIQPSMQPAAPSGVSDMTERNQQPNKSRQASRKAESRNKWTGGIARMLGLAPKRKKPSPNALARHKADHHPDAPPRPPLMASRDLPPSSIDSETHERARTTQSFAAAEQSGAFASHSAEASSGYARASSYLDDFDEIAVPQTPTYQPAQSCIEPEPQSPEELLIQPLTQPDVMFTPAETPRFEVPPYKAPTFEPASFTPSSFEARLPEPADHVPAPLDHAPREPALFQAAAAKLEHLSEQAPEPMPDLATASLTDLLARFEHGLSRRIAILEAQQASAHIEERLGHEPVKFRPEGAAARDDYSARDDLEGRVDSELRDALGALRKLTDRDSI